MPETAIDHEDEETVEEPVLELSTLAPDRPKVRIRSAKHPAGEIYELRTMDDLGVLDQHRRKAEGEEYSRLWNKKKLTHAEGDRFTELLKRLSDEVLIAPDEIKAALSDNQRQEVIAAFTGAPLKALLQKMKEEEEAREESSTSAS